MRAALDRVVCFPNLSRTSACLIWREHEESARLAARMARRNVSMTGEGLLIEHSLT